jgi:putative endonuclease
MKRAAAEAAGRKAEQMAAWWLRFHGWRILGQRLSVGVGEVDLVARRGRCLAFIEVKWRANAADLDHAIDRRRLTRVAAAAQILAPRYMRSGHDDDVRIDVMLLAPWRLPRHLVHVWQM